MRPFPQRQYVKVAETGELVGAGGFVMPAARLLKHVRLLLYKNGPAGGSERLLVKLFHDVQMTKLYAVSDWAAVADISNPATYWRGWLRFDFATPVWCAAATRYHLAVESQSYTRNGDTFYLSFVLDWPDPINIQESGPNAALAFELYDLRKVAAAP